MQWTSIGVLGKPHALEESLETFQELFHLLSKWNITTFYEAAVGALLNADPAHCLNPDALMQKSDLILVVGGDGSMLNAAHLAVKYGKPLLGINRGRLGFLTDIGPKELDKQLHPILQGAFSKETRALIQGEIHTKVHRKTSHVALNDIVLSLGASSQLIEFDLWINDAFVCRQRADGLIIATPTGSTAYALSAGGPILHPHLDALVIVPMLPHKLTSRPIVVSNQVNIKILLRHTHGPARVSFDSQDASDLDPNDSIHIQPHPQKLQLIHPPHYDYFKILRDKLHWESR